jgi:hypothetical protein
MDWLQNSKQQGNQDKMQYYAAGIQEFKRQQCLSISNFSDILMANDLDSQTNKAE